MENGRRRDISRREFWEGVQRTSLKKGTWKHWTIWKECRDYLDGWKIPSRLNTEKERKSFVNFIKKFFLHDDRIWWILVKGQQLRLVMEDIKRRGEILAQAHNEAGHWE